MLNFKYYIGQLLTGSMVTLVSLMAMLNMADASTQDTSSVEVISESVSTVATAGSGMPVTFAIPASPDEFKHRQPIRNRYDHMEPFEKVKGLIRIFRNGIHFNSRSKRFFANPLKLEDYFKNANIFGESKLPIVANHSLSHFGYGNWFNGIHHSKTRAARNK